jgi:hypothetical protein
VGYDKNTMTKIKSVYDFATVVGAAQDCSRKLLHYKASGGVSALHQRLARYCKKVDISINDIMPTVKFSTGGIPTFTFPSGKMADTEQFKQSMLRNVNSNNRKAMITENDSMKTISVKFKDIA